MGFNPLAKATRYSPSELFPVSPYEVFHDGWWHTHPLLVGCPLRKLLPLALFSLSILIHLCFISHRNCQSLHEREVILVRARPFSTALCFGTSPKTTARQGHGGTAVGPLGKNTIPLDKTTSARGATTVFLPWEESKGLDKVHPGHQIFSHSNGLIF